MTRLGRVLRVRYSLRRDGRKVAHANGVRIPMRIGEIIWRHRRRIWGPLP